MNAPLSEAVRRALAEVTLDDKCTLDRGRVLHERHAGARFAWRCCSGSRDLAGRAQHGGIH